MAVFKPGRMATDLSKGTMEAIISELQRRLYWDTKLQGWKPRGIMDETAPAVLLTHVEAVMHEYRLDPRPAREIFICCSWVCPKCYAEGNGRHQLRNGRCPYCREIGIQATGVVMQNIQSGEIVVRQDGGVFCDNCDDELVTGVLFPWNDDTGYACVEKCDECSIFEYDDDAGVALQRVLGAAYHVKPYDIKGRDYLAVFRQGEDEPLSFEEGQQLCEQLKQAKM
jgi:hypothetical protein